MKLSEDDPRAEVWNRYYGTLEYDASTSLPMFRWTAQVKDHRHEGRPYSLTVAKKSGRYRWTMRFWLWRKLRAVRNNAMRADDNGVETFD